MGHIFISYSRKDEEYVTKLVESLENEGFEVWIDRDLLTGDTWTQVINHKIDTCDAFVIVMTDESQKSNWVRREVLYAIQEGKKIFPLLLQGKLWMLLQDFNYFKVTNGLIPDRKFFNDMERFVPRSEAWLKTQREAVRKAEEFERQKAEKEKKDREFVERKQKEKGLHDKQARDARAKEKFILEKKEEKPPTVKTKSGGQIVFWFGSFIVLVLGIIFLSSLKNSPSTPQPTPENTQTQTLATLVQVTTSEPSVASPKSTITPVNTLTPTQTPLPTEITDAKGVSMVLVPAGEALVGAGSDVCDKRSFTNNWDKDWCESIVTSNPSRTVFVDAYYIDTYETSNFLYKECIKAGGCAPLPDTKLASINYYGNSKYDNYPVVWVFFDTAKKYCDWRGARLPTGLEWEKAARGTDGRTYPWGDTLGDAPTANFCDLGASCDWREIWNIRDGYPLTSPVDSFSNGRSPFGVYNLAGNVWEWISDSVSSGGTWATGYIRGGSWFETDVALAAYMQRVGTNFYGSDYGVRCAKDAP